MSLLDSIEESELGDVRHFNTSGPRQLDTQHVGRYVQPCSNTTSQAQPIFLLKTHVLSRWEHEPYRQHRGAKTG